MTADASFYVYALKDPRTSPAAPFYIGKGTGVRSHDHDARPDDTIKGQRIREIQAAGHQVLIARLVEALTESQALRIEAELIAAFGTVASGGLLTNTVMPAGLGGKSRPQLVVPSGVKEKAQFGLTLMKDAVLELAQANPGGITNSETASLLGLRSDYGGGSKDYLSYSVLGLLMREGKLARKAGGKKHVAQVR
ncbi:GIY-YIG nuclease family protein [Deinococcus sp.]|uniref:GIY-YIG nuclease family protein n=1 Tax=Deinococcus sp. TaxID=47478 RepID=UPI002869DF52|nr:GIY-YIG nuclease family protein [Deinococcus sp.]